MLLRLISLQADIERGRWKNPREPRLDVLPAIETPSTDVSGGKLTFLTVRPVDGDIDVVSSDIPNTL